MIDEHYSSDIHGDEMEGEIGVTPSMIDEVDSSDIEGDQTEGESGITQSIIDELHSSDILWIKEKEKVVLL